VQHIAKKKENIELLKNRMEKVNQMATGTPGEQLRKKREMLLLLDDINSELAVHEKGEVEIKDRKRLIVSFVDKMVQDLNAIDILRKKYQELVDKHTELVTKLGADSGSSMPEVDKSRIINEITLIVQQSQELRQNHETAIALYNNSKNEFIGVYGTEAVEMGLLDAKTQEIQGEKLEQLRQELKVEEVSFYRLADNERNALLIEKRNAYINACEQNRGFRKKEENQELLNSTERDFEITLRNTLADPNISRAQVLEMIKDKYQGYYGLKKGSPEYIVRTRELAALRESLLKKNVYAKLDDMMAVEKNKLDAVVAQHISDKANKGIILKGLDTLVGATGVLADVLGAVNVGQIEMLKSSNPASVWNKVLNQVSVRNALLGTILYTGAMPASLAMGVLKGVGVGVGTYGAIRDYFFHSFKKELSRRKIDKMSSADFIVEAEKRLSKALVHGYDLNSAQKITSDLLREAFNPNRLLGISREDYDKRIANGQLLDSHIQTVLNKIEDLNKDADTRIRARLQSENVKKGLAFGASALAGYVVTHVPFVKAYIANMFNGTR
jgi:hypothetical protein